MAIRKPFSARWPISILDVAGAVALGLALAAALHTQRARAEDPYDPCQPEVDAVQAMQGQITGDNLRLADAQSNLDLDTEALLGLYQQVDDLNAEIAALEFLNDDSGVYQAQQE